MFNITMFKRNYSIDLSEWPTWLALFGYFCLFAFIGVLIVSSVILGVTVRIAGIVALLCVPIAVGFMIWYMCLPHDAHVKLAKVGIVKCYNTKCWRDEPIHLDFKGEIVKS